MNTLEIVKEAYPDKDWESYEKAIFRAKNHIQWGHQEGLPSFESLLEVLKELTDLEHFWYDPELEQIHLSEPYQNPNNWEPDPDNEDEQCYMGPWQYFAVDPIDVVPSIIRERI